MLVGSGGETVTKATHAHHIVMREGLGGTGRQAVTESQKLLEMYRIDPFYGKENLIWAPNIGHTDKYASAVRDALKQADRQFGTRQAIVDALKDVGKQFREGKWAP